MSLPPHCLTQIGEQKANPKLGFVSLSGKFAKDGGIKVFVCVVFLLFLVHKPQESPGLGAFQATCVKSILYDLPVNKSAGTRLGRPICFEKDERRVLFYPHIATVHFDYRMCHFGLECSLPVSGWGWLSG